MNRAVRILCLLLILLYGCDTSTSPSDESGGCPPPVIEWDMPRIPGYVHFQQVLSPGGRFIAYAVAEAPEVEVLDLVNGTQKRIEIQKSLPDSIIAIACYRPIWCPYDEDRLLVHTVTFTDTVPDNNRNLTAYGANAYIVTISSGQAERITPEEFGAYGAEEGLGLGPWLAGSSPGNDSIRMFNVGNGLGRIYLLQEKNFIPDLFPASYFPDRQGSHYLSIRYVASCNCYSILLDDKQLQLPHAISSITDIKWSPTGRLAALSVKAGNGYGKVWILDIGKYLRSGSAGLDVREINLQKNFCRYSLMGLYAEFLTDSTLAISMHKDGDVSQLLWEVSTDGNLMRQLTYSP